MQRRYDKERSLSTWVYGPVIAQATLQETARMMMEAEDWAEASRIFLDLSAVERVDLSTADIAAFREVNSPLLAPSASIRVAALACNPIAEGVVRMYEGIVSAAGVTFRIFAERSECAEFLGVPEALLSPDPRVEADAAEPGEGEGRREGEEE